MSLFDTAKRSDGERRVTFTWSGPATREDTGSLWGDRVKLTIGHNKDRKRFEATVSRCEWSQGDGYVMERFGVFVDPIVTFHAVPCGRFSAGTFSNFVAVVMSAADNYATGVFAENATAAALFVHAATLAGVTA